MESVIKMQMINQYVGGMPPEIVEMIDGFIKESYEEEKKRLVYYYRKKVLKELHKKTELIFYELDYYFASEFGTDEREARDLENYYSIDRHVDHWLGIDYWYIHCA